MRSLQSSQHGAVDSRPLALELVRQQRLTRYQAAVLCQGKSKGLVLGNYVIMEKLGAGGMGMVFKARHCHLDRVVALKVLPPAVSQSAQAVRRFRREAEAAAMLHHPNIVAAHDADQAGDVHFLVMEYVEGTDLSRLVKSSGPLPVEKAVSCILQVARGLAHAHAAGIVHRDIKPANLLLETGGNVKVLDMGLARIDNADNDRPDSGTDELTKSGSILGTTDYMSPEQALNTKRADQRSDIYSLGATLYYLLVGRPMYRGETSMEKLLAHREQPIPGLRDENPAVPAALEAIYRRMVSKKPEDRYQSMSEVIAYLQGYLAGDVATTGRRPARQRRWVRYGVAGGGLVAAAAVLVAVLGIGRVETAGAPQLEPTNATRPVTATPTHGVVPDDWFKRVAGLKPEEQLRAVQKRMGELNPGFEDELQATTRDGAVVAVGFHSRAVTDLSPLRALTRLKSLRCGGAYQARGKLTDLTPLRGLQLTELDCSSTPVSDLSPLQGMPLEKLNLREAAVSNLAPLHESKLRVLDCSGTKVHDLSALHGLPLEELECGNTLVRDLGPLRDTPLRVLGCSWITTQDLRPLIGLPLEELRCVPRPEQFADLIRGLKNLKTLNGQPAADLRYALDETWPILEWQLLAPLALSASQPFEIPADGVLTSAILGKTYPGRDGKPISWRPVKADVLGVVDIRPTVESATLYAAATVDASADGDRTLLLGGDDRIAVWANGKKVYERLEVNSWALAGERATARLKKGINHILVRCDNLKGPWMFSVRISAEKTAR